MLVRLSILLLMVVLVAAMGRASSPPVSWATSSARTYGAFVCPAFVGGPAIFLSPSLAASAPNDERRQLTVLHESVHAEQARDAGSCWRFNAAMRTNRLEHLRSEAAAHCAEVHQQIAWLDQRYGDSSRWIGDPAERDGGIRSRWFRRMVRRAAENLLVRDGNYARIAELGQPVVDLEVDRACGGVPDFPAANHSLLRAPNVPVRPG